MFSDDENASPVSVPPPPAQESQDYYIQVRAYGCAADGAPLCVFISPHACLFSFTKQYEVIKKTKYKTNQKRIFVVHAVSCEVIAAAEGLTDATRI